MQKDGFASMNHSKTSSQLGFVVLATIPRVTCPMENSSAPNFSPKNSPNGLTDHVSLDVPASSEDIETTNHSAEWNSTRTTSSDTLETLTTDMEPLVLPGTPVFSVRDVSDTLASWDTKNAGHTNHTSVPQGEKSSTRQPTEATSTHTVSVKSPDEKRSHTVVMSRTLPERPRQHRRDWRVPMGVVAMLVVAFGVIQTIRQTIPEPIGPHSDLSQQIARSDAQKEKQNPQPPEAKINLTELEPMNDFGSMDALPTLTTHQPANPVTHAHVSSTDTATQTASLPMTRAATPTDLPLLPGTQTSEMGTLSTTNATISIAQNNTTTVTPSTVTPSTTTNTDAMEVDTMEVDTVKSTNRFDATFASNSEPTQSGRFASEPQLPSTTERFAENGNAMESMLSIPNGVAITADASQTASLAPITNSLQTTNSTSTQTTDSARPSDVTDPQNELPPLPAVPETPQTDVTPTDTVTSRPNTNDNANRTDRLPAIPIPDYPETGYVEITLPPEDASTYPDTKHGEIVIPNL